MIFEAVQQNNQADSSKNSLKTNAPSSVNPGMQMNSSAMEQEDASNDLASDMNPEIMTENESLDKNDLNQSENDKNPENKTNKSDFK